jgi:hypothetical protein
MEIISVILMFVFGNMNDQKTQMTQYIPMESLSSCMKEVRLLKKKNTEFVKDAFCGPGIVHIEDGEVISLYNEIPEGAVMVKKKISKEAFERWSLRAKEKWDK